jgi:hypothetical protein
MTVVLLRNKSLGHINKCAEPMANQTILIIRHADKPDGEATGIDDTGAQGPKSLTPRVWQRAGHDLRKCPRWKT